MARAERYAALDEAISGSEPTARCSAKTRDDNENISAKGAAACNSAAEWLAGKD